MDFQLSDDQEALREGVRSFCEGRVPFEQLSALEERSAFDPELWSELAEMGVFNLRLAEAQGGVGLGNADAVLVFVELGRRLIPGPLAWTHLAAGLVEGAASGEVVVGGLDLVAGASGPLLVEHRDHLNALLVLNAQDISLVENPAALDAEPIEQPLDPLTPLHVLRQLPDAKKIAGPEQSARMRLEGAALVAGQQLGIAEASLELAVDYAKKREQFDRPIGSFQAIKHILADMYVRQEVARAAVYAAGATLDEPEVGDVVRAVSAAKITAGEAALKNSRACIQVHGGMGYTWEVPAHYFLKRSWVFETLFGTTEEHAERAALQVEQSGRRD